MTYARSTALGLILAVLLAAVYVSMLGCPDGWHLIEGGLFSQSACIGVEDGVVMTANAEWRLP